MFRLIGEENELNVILAKALIDSGAQISSFPKSFTQIFVLKINGLQTILNLETVIGSEIIYLAM